MDTVYGSRTTRGIAFAMLVVCGQSAWADTKCDAPPETWQPRSAVTALAERNGWQIERLKVDDGCYEIKGRDAQGQRLKAKIDPASLQVIDVKHERGERERERRRTGAAPPPSAPTGPPMPASAGSPG